MLESCFEDVYSNHSINCDKGHTGSEEPSTNHRRVSGFVVSCKTHIFLGKFRFKLNSGIPPKSGLNDLRLVLKRLNPDLRLVLKDLTRHYFKDRRNRENKMFSGTRKWNASRKRCVESWNLSNEALSDQISSQRQLKRQIQRPISRNFVYFPVINFQRQLLHNTLNI